MRTRPRPDFIPDSFVPFRLSTLVTRGGCNRERRTGAASFFGEICRSFLGAGIVFAHADPLV